jgi:hypothetical protein
MPLAALGIAASRQSLCRTAPALPSTARFLEPTEVIRTYLLRDENVARCHNRTAPGSSLKGREGGGIKFYQMSKTGSPFGSKVRRASFLTRTVRLAYSRR